MNRSQSWTTCAIRLALLAFSAFLGVVIYAADLGAGPRYWGWLSRVPLGDKFCHLGFMSTLTALTNLALRCRRGRLSHHSLLLGTLIVAIVVVAEEFLQIWIPGRNFELLDLSADLLGIACGDLAARRLQPGLAARSTGALERGSLSRQAL
jgi:hypothetical protein